MNEPITRQEVERMARAFLEKTRTVTGPARREVLRMAPSQFEAIVEKEVALTIRQMRGVGRVVLD